MKKGFYIILLSALLPMAGNAQLRGTVYHDTNRNSVRDTGEKPLAGVSVTDGLHVVKTDEKGEFELPGEHPQARFVTVTTPSGYRPARTHYLKIEPERASYDFGLTKTAHTGAFDFIHITDTEATSYKDWLDNLKDYTETNPTAFIVHTGDICYQPGLAFHGTNVQSRQMGIPMYYTVGNHDLVAGDYGEQLFEQYFGPAWHSFEVGNVHFMALPMLGGDHAPSYKPGQILQWMQNDLAQTDPDKKVIMLCHDLWFQGDDLIFRDRKNGDSIDMARHNLEAFVYGHWHSQYVREVAGIKTFCSSTPDKGGIDHSPACFRVIHIDEKGSVSNKNQARYTQINGTLTLAYPSQEGRVSASKDGFISLRVNTYRTVSPTASVQVSTWENGKKGKTVHLHQDTDWAWSGSIYVGKQEQKKELRIEALFEDGTRLVEYQRFNITHRTPQIRTGEPWGNLGGDPGHTSVVEGNLSRLPVPAWTQNAKGNIYMTSPVVGNGLVFTATIDDDNLENCFIAAYDAQTGNPVWKYKTGNSVKGSMAYANGLLFACDAEMVLYALEESSGNLKWSKRLTGHMLPQNIQGLAIADGIIYAGQGNGFTALRAENGEIVWQNREWSGGEGSQSTITVGNGVAIASAHWNGLFGHDVNTGKLLWKKQDSNTRFRDGSPTLYDGEIYLASANGLFRFHPVSGNIVKSVIHPDISFHAATAPVVTPELIYVATANKGVVAFDRQTFQPVWTYKTKPALFYSVPYIQDYEMSVETTPLLVGETLVFGASDGYLYGVNATTGRFQWRRNLGAPIFSSPAVSGNGLYVTDFSGNIYGFIIPDAKE